MNKQKDSMKEPSSFDDFFAENNITQGNEKNAGKLESTQPYSFYDDSMEGSNTSNYCQDEDLWKQKKVQEELIKMLLKEDFDFTRWIERFKKFKYTRFLYSEISSYIINEENDIKVGTLVTNLNTITGKIKKEDSTKNEKQSRYTSLPKEKYEMLYKLYDHCNLACTQRGAYKNTKRTIENEVNSLVDKKMSEYEKSITTQLISLVSIFTALSFVIFGGINILDNLMQNIRIIPLLKTLFVSDLWLICMSNLFILFIKLICKLTSKEINLKQYAKTINIILISILVVLFIVYLIRYRNSYYIQVI